MFFARSKTIGVKKILEDVLNSMSDQLIVVQEGKCKVLFANSAARHAFWKKGKEPQCHNLDDNLRNELCMRCPNCNTIDTCKDLVPFIKDADDHWYSVEVTTVNWLDGQPAVLFSLHSADNEQMNAQQLYRMAYIDSLTRLPNREKLSVDFEQAIGFNSDEQYGVLALFDMDLFKQVNDTYGHSTGNLLLKRLAQHLQMTPEFKGKLYRLGGDEFVLLFLRDKLGFAKEAEMRSYFEDLLRIAFYSYTMPNIELECTISMGVSYYPAHGSSLSELLRKADIALYEAKNGGRNKMVVFEEWHDTARRFSDYYINIRPILSTLGHTYGYELVDNRQSESKQACTLNLNMQEVNLAIDALSPEDLESEHRYFIHYNHRLGNPAVIANHLENRFVIQIPDDLAEEEINAYRELQKLGYRLAANYVPGISAQLLELVDYVRLFASSIEKSAALIKKYPDKQFISAGIHTAAEHANAQNVGFQLYQGSFYNQPVIVKTGKDIEPLKLSYSRLLTLACSNQPVDFKEVADIIASDIALTYKLLRLLNSVAAGIGNRVSSVAMAVTYMGEETLKKWIALLAIRGLVGDKPMEIVRISLIRARFGELLSPHISPHWDVNQIFLTGMFSLLHIALDTTREALMEELRLAEDIRTSLLTEDGPYSKLLAFFSHYEYSNWDDVALFSQQHSLECTLIYNCYISAVKWFNELAILENNE